MTQTNKKTAAVSAQPKKAPTLIAWNIVANGEKNFWNRVGAAWGHADKMGFNLILERIPVDGRIVLRPSVEGKERGA